MIGSSSSVDGQQKTNSAASLDVLCLIFSCQGFLSLSSSSFLSFPLLSLLSSSFPFLSFLFSLSVLHIVLCISIMACTFVFYGISECTNELASASVSNSCAFSWTLFLLFVWSYSDVFNLLHLLIL